MKKRGQISFFLILGVVLLIIVGFSSYIIINAQTRQLEPDQKQLEISPANKETIQKFVESCLQQVAEPYIIQMGLNGGHVNLTSNRNYLGFNYPYLCMQKEDRGCVNTLVTRYSMEQELNNVMEDNLHYCVNFTSFRQQGYNIEEGSFDVRTTIAVNDITIQLTYPLTIVKQDFVLELDQFSKSLRFELGKLSDLAVKIMWAEQENNYFEKDEWMFNHGAEIQVQKHRPYPDIVYELKKFNKETKLFYIFRFALQGKDTISLVVQPTPIDTPYDYCMTGDNNCYANVKPQHCNEINAYSTPTPPQEGLCTGQSTYNDIECFDGNCNDCGIKKHGESWCSYDGPVGAGFDYVGTRHYLLTCIDGKVYHEECRDFREELCTMNKTESLAGEEIDHAVCRVNRWQDCAAQKNQQDCEKDEERDCYWSGWLYDSTNPAHGIQRPEQRCHPQIPPGFRFWQQNGADVCMVGNEQRYCYGYSCPRTWVYNNAQLCYFQGDCGNYRNIANTITKGAFYTTDTRGQQDFLPWYVYLTDEHINRNYQLSLRTDTRNHILTDGHEYDNPQGTFDAIIEEMAIFADVISTWDYCTFCDSEWYCPGWTDGCCVDCEYDEDTFAAAICLPWQPPEGRDDCHLCNETRNKPCTEYQCLSLGLECIYKEINGTGYCIEPDTTDTIGPNITYDGSILGDFTIEEDIFTFGAESVDGYYICRGDSCNDDKSGTDGLEPYSQLFFAVNLTEPAVCKIFPFPNLNYTRIPGPGSGQYQDIYAFFTKILPQNEFNDKIKDLLDMESFVEIGTVDRYDSKFLQIRDDTISAIDQFDDVIDDPGGKKQQVNDMYDDWKLIMEPMLRHYFNELGDLIQAQLIEMEKGNVVLFFECMDKAGNYNPEDFFIKYTIGKDTIPPILISSEPENQSMTKSPFNLTIAMHEPSECRYSFEDKSFSFMPYLMDCATTEFSTLFGTFDCKDEITFPENQHELDIYVKCKDQPRLIKKYNLHLNKTNEFNISHQDKQGMIKLYEGNKINITNDYILRNNNTVINVSTPDVVLNLFRDERSRCRYSEDAPLPFDLMTKSFNCSSSEPYLCNQTLSTNSEDYYIGCKGFVSPARNINSGDLLKFFKISS